MTTAEGVAASEEFAALATPALNEIGVEAVSAPEVAVITSVCARVDESRATNVPSAADVPVAVVPELGPTANVLPLPLALRLIVLPVSPFPF